MTHIAMEAMALIEIDGLPINSMVDLSMANCECHNQMVPGPSPPSFARPLTAESRVAS